jgi:hypothetical protein
MRCVHDSMTVAVIVITQTFIDVIKERCIVIMSFVTVQIRDGHSCSAFRISLIPPLRILGGREFNPSPWISFEKPHAIRK